MLIVNLVVAGVLVCINRGTRLLLNVFKAKGILERRRHLKDENLKRRERHGGIGLGDETNSLPEFIDDMRFSALSKKNTE